MTEAPEGQDGIDPVASEEGGTGSPRPAHFAPRRRRALVEWGIVAVVAVVAALLVRSFVFEAFYIPSGSMEPTLDAGDRVIVDRLSYHLHPVHIGDIIVFHRPPWDNTTTAAYLIKRVVAVGGETLYVHNCGVFVNGKEIPQPYLPKGWQQPGSPYCTTWDGDNNLPNPFKVPKGDYFVMGDNRYDSADSRFWGALPGKYIVGRAFIEVWPLSHLRFL